MLLVLSHLDRGEILLQNPLIMAKIVFIRGSVADHNRRIILWVTFAEVAGINQVPLLREIVQKRLRVHTNTSKNLMTAIFVVAAAIAQTWQQQVLAVRPELAITVT